MKLKDADLGILIDDEFPCSSAGEMRLLEPGVYEIGYQPEEIPQWFQDLLDEGIYLPPSPYETGFLSTAHTEAHILALGQAVRGSVDRYR